MGRTSTRAGAIQKHVKGIAGAGQKQGRSRAEQSGTEQSKKRDGAELSSRSLEGAGQEYGRSRAEGVGGVGKEQGRSLAGAGQAQDSSKAVARQE